MRGPTVLATLAGGNRQNRRPPFPDTPPDTADPATHPILLTGRANCAPRATANEQQRFGEGSVPNPKHRKSGAPGRWPAISQASRVCQTSARCDFSGLRESTARPRAPSSKAGYLSPSPCVGRPPSPLFESSRRLVSPLDFQPDFVRPRSRPQPGFAPPLSSAFRLVFATTTSGCIQSVQRNLRGPT